MIRLTSFVVTALMSMTFIAGQKPLPNWIGPQVGAPRDSACYRKSFFTRQCPPGFEFDRIATCWARCPIEYPVECGMECIPQNKGCLSQIFRKIDAVVSVPLNMVTAGMFDQLRNKHKSVQAVVRCGAEIHDIGNKIIKFTHDFKVANPNTTKEQIEFVLSKSDFAAYDLPRSVGNCIGVKFVPGQELSVATIKTIKAIIKNFIGASESGVNPANPDHISKFATAVGIDSLVKLTPKEINDIKGLISAAKTCTGEVRAVIDEIVKTITELKKTNIGQTAEQIRLIVAGSDLVTKALPNATLGCMSANAPDGYKTRDEILKSARLIIDRIVSAADKNGKPVSAAEFFLIVADMGLDAISQYDPTGLAKLAEEYIQPICGPTGFIGEVDSGPLDKALGLKTMQKAFRGSYGEWIRSGSDGMVKITFESDDFKDVTVNIKSGGNRFDNVKVRAKSTVSWTRPIKELEGYTLYMDRWRPGLFGIPGTGGGSLLLWVPTSTEKGHLELRVKINPTKFNEPED
jgi:hypothetical protein